MSPALQVYKKFPPKTLPTAAHLLMACDLATASMSSLLPRAVMGLAEHGGRMAPRMVANTLAAPCGARLAPYLFALPAQHSLKKSSFDGSRLFSMLSANLSIFPSRAPYIAALHHHPSNEGLRHSHTSVRLSASERWSQSESPKDIKLSGVRAQGGRRGQALKAVAEGLTTQNSSATLEEKVSCHKLNAFC